MLDYNAFPHIFDLVLLHSPTSAYPALRATCRKAWESVDSLSVRHLTVHGTEPDGKGVPTFTVGAAGDRAPVCVSIFQRAGRSHSCAARAAKLIGRGTATLDITAPAAGEILLQVSATWEALHTVRLRLRGDVIRFQTLGSKSLIPIPPTTRRIVIFPCDRNLAIGAVTPGTVEKVVFHLQPVQGQLLPLMLYRELTGLDHVVLICTPAASIVEASLILPPCVATTLLNVDKSRFTIVDVHNYLQCQPSPEAQEAARAQVVDHMCGEDSGCTDTDIEAIVRNRINFMSLDEYRATVGDRAFALETVEVVQEL